MASLIWENQSTFQPGLGGEDCSQENKTLGSAHFFQNLIILALNFDLLKFNRRKQEQFNWLSQVVGNTTLLINPTMGGSSSKQDVLRTYLGMLDCTSVRRLFERYFICRQIKRTLLIIYFNTRYYADFLLFNYSLVEVLGLAHNAPCTNFRWPMKHLKKLNRTFQQWTGQIKPISFKDRRRYQNEWIFGKVPNGLWPLPCPHLRMIFISFFTLRTP